MFRKNKAKNVDSDEKAHKYDIIAKMIADFENYQPQQRDVPVQAMVSEIEELKKAVMAEPKGKIRKAVRAVDMEKPTSDSAFLREAKFIKWLQKPCPKGCGICDKCRQEFMDILRS